VDGEEEAVDEEGSKRKSKGKGKQQKYVEGSTDCVAMIDETMFLSAGDSGYVDSALFYPRDAWGLRLHSAGLFHYGCLQRRSRSSLILWPTASTIRPLPVQRLAPWRSLAG
jgi:hypothetical protein